MSTINERIELLIATYTNGNKRAFAMKVGVSGTTVENVVGERKGKPGFDLLEKIILSIESVDGNWLLTGKGSMERSAQVAPVSNKELIDEMVSLAKQNGFLEARVKELEQSKKHTQPIPYDAVAEPIPKLEKGKR